MESQTITEKIMEFTGKIASLETTLINQKDTNETAFETQSKNMRDLRQDFNDFATEQRRIQDSLLQIQGKQSQQIDSIQKTLEEFTDIRKQVTQHKSRIKSLEEQVRSEKEIQKENTKGRWATIAAMVAAIGSIIATLVTTLLR